MCAYVNTIKKSRLCDSVKRAVVSQWAVCPFRLCLLTVMALHMPDERFEVKHMHILYMLQ